MLEDFTRDYADFNAALMRESYLFHSGQKSQLELKPIYERYSDLYSLESVTGLKELLDETPINLDTKRASLRRLLSFAIDQYVAASVKDLTEAIGEYESKATVQWSAREMTFHESSIAITTERDRGERRSIYARRARVIEDSTDLRAKRISKIHESAARISGRNGSANAVTGNYRRLYEDLLQLDFECLSAQVRRLLEVTESAYAAQLDRVLKRDIGVGVDDAERHDALYLLHQNRYNDWFPERSLLDVYKETMAGLGIHVDSQKNIEIDSEARPHKTPRAFCAPILVPEQIKLVIRPIGGQSDYLTLLHEGGHAQHYGWTSRDLSPEFKYTGDYALSETYAFLFNHLPCEADWLTFSLGLRENGDLIGSMMLAKLVTVRRYAAKFLYECELHDNGDLATAPSLYAEMQTRATKFLTAGTEFLFDLDDSFYSASYLRAWAFEVILRDYLKSRFGKAWWSSRRAGSFLKEIWETGDRYTADEMASQIGIGPITMAPLVDEFAGCFARAWR
jgi:oligoendopeptidase F